MAVINFCKELIVGVLVLCLLAGCDDGRVFKSLSPEQTGIDFNNRITENDTFNILQFEYVYNGGGVALADFNDDGLVDVFFTGNMVTNRLYMNRGDMRFEDVTEAAGVAAADRWCSGVAVVDINADGLKDLYVCATVRPEVARRNNLLLIQTGRNEQGVPLFTDRADAYGVADSSHSTNAAFLDYDLDGDLDLFVLANEMGARKTPNIYKKQTDAAPERVDRLYRNDWDSLKGHPVFTDISAQAGIRYEGYSLGVNVADLNNDGWPDIYVTNDYLSQDLVYINQQNGTFKNEARAYFRHTSYSAMGNDVVDMNNDGLAEIVALDMMPEDNYRKKTMLMSNNYITYINNEKYDYQHQYVRNTLQVHQGWHPVTGHPVYTELALMAGISSTDWSWAPLVADFDHDGWRDLIVTNGFPKDITDRDFSDYNVEVGRYASQKMLLSEIPSVKLKNYAYRNTGGVTFEDVTDQWGIQEVSFSNGAAYADLDNDGDLDYVVNNIDDPAFVFQNMTNDRKATAWLKLKLEGSGQNRMGLGAKIRLTTSGKQYFWEHTLYRGYLSSMDEIIHFGLGEATVVDSLEVTWPSGEKQWLTKLPINQQLVIRQVDAQPFAALAVPKPGPVFQELPLSALDSFVHQEVDFIDYNIQPLLLHKLSQYGPGLAVGDVNGDRLDDVYVSGSTFHKGTFLMQQPDGSFRKADLLPGESGDNKANEEQGALLFDADADGDNDLYVVSGSGEQPAGHPGYGDRFYENRNGVFALADQAIPEILLSGSAVRAADFDRDGDLDLFIGGRVAPHEYPTPVSSLLLRNESSAAGIRFVLDDGAARVLKNLGMVTDALWTDFDNDTWPDLVLVGEWMPLTLLRNDKGNLINVTRQSGVSDRIGWWNSLVAGDFNKDGLMDYMAGNVGHNTVHRATDTEPVCLYAADFDKNGALDIMPALFLKNTTGHFQEFPYFGRGDVTKRMVYLKDRYKKHAAFAIATIGEMLTREQLVDAQELRANHLGTALFLNEGNGRFVTAPVPAEVQTAPVFGMVMMDANSDGHPDVLMVGNDYSWEVLMGRMDAFHGLCLYGDGKGSFRVGSTSEGFVVSGDAKALTYVLNADGRMTLLASQNRGPVAGFQWDASGYTVLDLPPTAQRVSFTLPDGSIWTQEAPYGHSFLSQSSRRILIPTDASEVKVVRYDGAVEEIE